MLVCLTLCFLVGFLTSCKSDSPKPAGVLGLRQVGLVTTTLSSKPGFVEWADAKGTVFILRVFDRDTNKDGKIEGRVGEHGEPEGDTPRLVVVDREGIVLIAPNELIATDSSSRFFVYQLGVALFLFDAHTSASTILADADFTADLGNPCMKPRAAAFDISGRWLGWMLPENRYRIRDLKTGAEETVQASGKLWRAEPTPFGWAAMKVVEIDARFPMEKTSCACSWCPRFARSIGKYGVDGRSTSLLVKDEHVIPLDRALLPLGSNTWVDLKTNQLQKPGALVPVALPKGCVVSGVAFGSAGVVLTCGAAQVVYFPETGAQLALDDSVSFLESPDQLADWGSGAKSFVSVRRQNTTYVAVLNWETGAVELGPQAERFGKPNGKWILADVGGNLILFANDGSRTAGKGKPDPNVFGFIDDHGLALVDPQNATFAYVAAAKRVAGPCALNDGISEISSSIRVQCVEH